MGDKSDDIQLAVGIGVVIENDRVLMVKREDTAASEYRDKWELPGGKIEISEWTEKAIEREVVEETGITVDCSNILPFTFSHTIRKKDERVHALVFCAECVVEKPSDTPHEKETDEKWEWFNIESLDFEEIIPGSKEFLIWALNERGHDIPDKNKRYRIGLENLNEEDNKRRAYRIIFRFHPGVNKPYEVESHWGRIGVGMEKRSKSFSKYADALENIKNKVIKRGRHNYKVTDIDSNHPLRTWIENSSLTIGKTEWPDLFRKDE